MVNHDNIEDYIIDFISEELTEAEINELNAFLEQNPQYNILLEEYQSTILTDDIVPHIEYSHTESLKRVEDVSIGIESHKPWPYYSLGIAVLIGGVAFWMINISDSKSLDPVSDDIKKSTAPLSTTPPTIAQPNGITVKAGEDKRAEKTQTHASDTKNSLNKNDHRSPAVVPVIVDNYTPVVTPAKTIETIDPLYFTPRVKQHTLVVHTELITPEQLPKYYSNTTSGEIEFSIAGKVVDLNLESLQEIKSKIDDVKQTINDRVEEASADPISLWEIIKK